MIALSLLKHKIMNFVNNFLSIADCGRSTCKTAYHVYTHNTIFQLCHMTLQIFLTHPPNLGEFELGLPLFLY